METKRERINNEVVCICIYAGEIERYGELDEEQGVWWKFITSLPIKCVALIFLTSQPSLSLSLSLSLFIYIYIYIISTYMTRFYTYMSTIYTSDITSPLLGPFGVSSSTRLTNSCASKSFFSCTKLKARPRVRICNYVQVFARTPMKHRKYIYIYIQMKIPPMVLSSYPATLCTRRLARLVRLLRHLLRASPSMFINGAIHNNTSFTLLYIHNTYHAQT